VIFNSDLDVGDILDTCTLITCVGSIVKLPIMLVIVLLQTMN